MGAIYAPRTTTKGRTSAIRVRGRSPRLIKIALTPSKSAQVHDLVRVQERGRTTQSLRIKVEDANKNGRLTPTSWRTGGVSKAVNGGRGSRRCSL